MNSCSSILNSSGRRHALADDAVRSHPNQYILIRSTAFLKHRTNWDSVRSAVRSFTWSTIQKLADPLVTVALVRHVFTIFFRYLAKYNYALCIYKYIHSYYIHCAILQSYIVWAALMYFLPYLITFRSVQIQGWSLSFSSKTLIQPSIVGSVLSIYREFLSDSWQRVVVDDTTNQWIPIVSGMPQGSVFGPLLFILYTSKMFEQVENRPYAYEVDTTLLYWQLSACKQTNLLLLPPLSGTWLGFRSGVITGT